MKKLAFFPLLGWVCLWGAWAHASSVVLTNNTYINPVNISYDGDDIVVSNCTVTVDGPHGFNSVWVGAGGVLTHSFLASGSTSVPVNVTNEPQTLDAFLAVTLLNTNVSGQVLVTDTSSTVTYINGIDYAQTNLNDGTTQIYRLPGSAIPDAGNVLVSYAWTYSYSAGLLLTVSN